MFSSSLGLEGLLSVPLDSKGLSRELVKAERLFCVLFCLRTSSKVVTSWRVSLWSWIILVLEGLLGASEVSIDLAELFLSNGLFRAVLGPLLLKVGM